MRVGVHELAEAQLAEHDPRAEEACVAVEAALDPVLAQEVANLHHGRAVGTEPERIGDDGRLVRMRLEAPSSRLR